jgi:hypothetical protein
MCIEDFLSHLKAVRQRGHGYVAHCPAHDDRSPSLSIHEGDKGILVRCWAGCTLEAICTAVGIRTTDLFFESLTGDPRQRREAARQREAQRRQREAERYRTGLQIDARREAEYFIRSRRGLEISQWSDQRLNDEMSVMADAYILLDSETRDV